MRPDDPLGQAVNTKTLTMSSVMRTTWYSLELVATQPRRAPDATILFENECREIRPDAIMEPLADRDRGQQAT
jgi:hypothetical protein